MIRGRSEYVCVIILSCWCFVGPTASTDAGYRLTVHNVTASSAVLHWTPPTKAREADFKILCAGRRDYLTSDGAPAVDEASVTQYTSGMVGQMQLESLKINFNYSCVVTEEVPGTKHGVHILSKPVLFSTVHGAPERPRPPEIREQTNKTITIKLFPTSTKYGPISGYEIWFHQLVNDISNQLDPQAQENILITDLVPSDTVKLSYDDGVLPDTLYTGEKLLQNALKGGATYHVATVAFTERQPSHDLVDPLSSASRWSSSFTMPETFSSPPPSPMSFRAQYGEKSARILLGGLLPLLLILGCVGMCVGYKKLKAYKRARKKHMYSEIQKNSWLPLGVQVANHEGILTDHQRVLDRITRDMEAEHLELLLTPHTLTDMASQHHKCNHVIRAW